MSKRKSSDELVRQLERESDDTELWTQEPAHIEARPTFSSVLSVRLPRDEFRALLAAAREADETVSEYVRKAITMRQTNQQLQSR